MKLRIREDLPLTLTYQWANPVWRPKWKKGQDPQATHAREQQRLNDDAALFKARATFAGL
jgi:hypothetical protein